MPCLKKQVFKEANIPHLITYLFQPHFCGQRCFQPHYLDWEGYRPEQTSFSHKMRLKKMHANGFFEK